MTDFDKSPRQILAVTDESQGQIALRSAMAMAEQHGAALQVLTCVEPPHDLSIVARISGRAPDTLIATLVERKRAAVHSRLRQVFPDRQLDLHVSVGKAFVEIIRHVSETGCDFVIKAAEPLSGVNRFLFASTDQHLLRKCPCPVWLQTPAADVTPKRVLAAIDLDMWDAEEPETLAGLNARVIEVARSIAGGPDAEVIVLHAWDAVGEGLVWAFSSDIDARAVADQYVSEIFVARQRAMDRFLEALQPRSPSAQTLVPMLVRGSPEQVIEKQSREIGADVVVLGTVARTGISGIFIGNTAENIINTLGCPVVAVKPEGFVSPLFWGLDSQI